MKKKIAGTFLIFAALVSGAMSFVAARSYVLTTHQADADLEEWLAKASTDAVAIEEQFKVQMNELKGNLRSEQLAFAGLLTDSSATDDAIVSQSEKVAAAHADLIRGVGRHVVRIRERLPEKKKHLFMNICAGNLRGPMCRMPQGAPMGRMGGPSMPRRGGPGPMGPRGGPGPLPGRGGRGPGDGRGGPPPMGGRGGPGMGMMDHGHERRGGPGWGRRRRGPAVPLGLSGRQIEIADKHDPDFQGDIERLRGELLKQRADMLEAFENPQTSDQQLLEMIDELAVMSGNIEKRLTQHLVILRPHLKADQHERLRGLCGGFGARRR